MTRRQFKRTTESESFICSHCGYAVGPVANGGRHRNHCPRCLWSRHLDTLIGDRSSSCRGNMEPIGVWVQKDREWALLHRCTRCGFIRANRIAGDDSEAALMALALKPVTGLPFPADAAFRLITD